MLEGLLSRLDTELVLDGEKAPDIFGGKAPPIGAVVRVSTHVSHFGDKEPGQEPDKDGYVHIRFRVVAVDYEIVLGEKSIFHDRRAVIKGEVL